MTPIGSMRQRAARAAAKPALEEAHQRFAGLRQMREWQVRMQIEAVYMAMQQQMLDAPQIEVVFPIH
jgi:hypothetical protein